MIEITTILTISVTLLWALVTITHENDIITQDKASIQNENSKIDNLLKLNQETLSNFWEAFLANRYPNTDPDAGKNLSELIVSQGFHYESYTVQTSDGFLLDLHRIPNGRQGSTPCRKCQGQKKPVIFLQHALLSSACDWVLNFAEGSLGFILADAGYDVWMGNSRGNTYSHRHISLKPDDEKFWDWSFDEMAHYDLPAFLDFVLQKAGAETLYYVGHSQGTTTAFALFSQRPDLSHKIKLFFALAPVTQITYIKSPIKYVASLPDHIIYNIVGRKDFLSNTESLRQFGNLFCKNSVTKWVCMNIMFLFIGYDLNSLNQTRMPVYVSHVPAGVSVKDLVHFAQLYKKQKFTMYDYGSPLRNQRRYNQSQPPVYDMKKVNVPVVSFTGTNDWMADPRDTAALLNSLPNLKAKYELQGWNHMDFVWGMDAAKLCYATILQWLNKETS